MQAANDPLRTAKLMSSFKRRMQLASEAAVVEEVANKDSSLNDLWHAPTRQLRVALIGMVVSTL
jgi:hypothetical protein